MVIVTPACFAMAIAIDPVAVFESIGPVILWPMSPGAAAARDTDKSREDTQYSHPMKRIHLLTLAELSACSYETRKFG